ncbi:MAG TPA: HlyD family secretion protein [Planctomycetaceae bacterium]|nr:HlyD family secretion protein [Planctomycetaceae bacterium]
MTEVQTAPAEKRAEPLVGPTGERLQAPAPAVSKRHWLRWVVLLIIAALIVVAAVVWGIPYIIHMWTHESTDDAFIDAHVVQMAPKVAGYARVHVDDNQLVKQGELLVEIEPRDYQLAVEVARAAEKSAVAALEQARAQVASAETNVKAAEADVASAKATAQNYVGELERQHELLKKGATTRENYDAALAQARTSDASVAASEARLRGMQAQQKLAEAALQASEASRTQSHVQVEQAQQNLGYTRITAPVAGRVTHRSVSTGDYLQVGQALLAIVPAEVYVTANFKETQLTHMKVGQKVRVHVDAFPQRDFRAHVDSFQAGTGSRFTLLPPENATGNYVKVVQRVPVKIVFDEPVEELRDLSPGMSVEPDVSLEK